MLAEMITKIADMAKENTRFERITANDESEIIRFPDGTVREFDAVPTKRRFATRDLQAFCDVVLQGEGPLLVCVTPFQARGFLNGDWRDEFVDLKLSPSVAFQAIREFANWTTQREAVAVLRDHLFDCTDPALLATMRKIDWSRRSDGSKSIEHGRESLGRGVEMAVQSRGGELAEYYDFEVPVYVEEPLDVFQYRVVAAFESDVPNERVRFVVRGDGLKQAEGRAANYLRGEIANLLPQATVVIAEPLSCD